MRERNTPKRRPGKLLVRGCRYSFYAAALPIGDRKSKIENVETGPDWARTSDPALIKRML